MKTIHETPRLLVQEYELGDSNNEPPGSILITDKEEFLRITVKIIVDQSTETSHMVIHALDGSWIVPFGESGESKDTAYVKPI